MKDFIFVSDFDGTLTKRDFYHIIMDRYLGEWGRELYKKWKRQELKDFDFLNMIFQSINKNENDILDDIYSIELDPYTGEFINKIKSKGGDFLILSAGTRYYIDRLLAFRGISDVNIISNEGVYKDRGITMLRDMESPFYSDIYGVDKEKAVQNLRQEYRKIFYAGDSGPDLKAAMSADMAFAKNSLVDLMQASGHNFISFNYFSEIGQYLDNHYFQA